MISKTIRPEVCYMQKTQLEAHRINFLPITHLIQDLLKVELRLCVKGIEVTYTCD